MTNITIPPEALEAAARAAYEVWRHDCAGELDLDLLMYRLWDQLELDEQERWCSQSRAAIAAGLAAWEGMEIDDGHLLTTRHTVLLPLPPEPNTQEDPECTCCGGTGVTYQTERRCACQPDAEHD